MSIGIFETPEEQQEFVSRIGNLRSKFAMLDAERQAALGDPRRLDFLRQEQKEKQRKQLIEQFKMQNPNMAGILDALEAGIPYQLLKDTTTAKQDRKTIKAADGYNYFVDTGERVIPSVQKENVKNQATIDYKNYLNTLGPDEEPTGAGFFTFLDRNVKQEKLEFKTAKDKNGFLRYLEGPQKGQRVFPDVVEITDETEEKQKIFENERKLRSDFDDSSKVYIDVKNAYGRILSADISAAGDLSLIFNYMKMLDPGSVVREGEFANAQNSASVPDRIRATYNRVLEGERLAEETRNDFIQQAENLYTTALDGQTQLEQRYKGLAENYGLSVDNVVANYHKDLDRVTFENKIDRMSLEELTGLDPTKYTDAQLEIIEKVLQERTKK